MILSWSLPIILRENYFFVTNTHFQTKFHYIVDKMIVYVFTALGYVQRTIHIIQNCPAHLLIHSTIFPLPIVVISPLSVVSRSSYYSPLSQSSLLCRYISSSTLRSAKHLDFFQEQPHPGKALRSLLWHTPPISEAHSTWPNKLSNFSIALSKRVLPLCAFVPSEALWYSTPQSRSFP